jgi:phage terminase small subunit
MALTDRQQLFVSHYVVCWNATEAAKKAGYSEKTARSIGSENLTKPDIAAAIAAHIAGIMPAGEVLTRLAGHARGTMADFINVEQETLDLNKAHGNDKLHLVKKFSRSETKYGTNISIELYDAQAALALLGKHHGLFTEKVEHSGPGGGPIPVREIVVKLPSSHESVDA